MRNYAGQTDKDTEIASELEQAGINVHRLPESFRESHPEMRTVIVGGLHGWEFRRAWYYWIATGPGIPLDAAETLQASHGQEVRANGDCVCRGPLFWNNGFGTGSYHVDTQEGLNALADTLRRIVRPDAREEPTNE